MRTGTRATLVAGALVAVLSAGCDPRVLPRGSTAGAAVPDSADPASPRPTPDPIVAPGATVPWPEGRLVPGWGRPCAANSDGSRLAYVVSQVIEPNSKVATGALWVRGAGSGTTVESGRVADCDTVQFAPTGNALAWRAGLVAVRGGGFWGSGRDRPDPLTVTAAADGGWVDELAFSADGRWFAAVVVVSQESSTSNVVVRVGATDGLTGLADVPVSPSDAWVAFAPDGGLLVSSVEGEAFRNVGVMRLYRVEPATAAARLLATVAGTSDDLLGVGTYSIAIRVLPRVIGGALVYAGRGDTSWRGTLVESALDGSDARPLIDSVRAFSDGFGAGGKHVFVYSAPADSWDGCCALLDLDLQTGTYVPVPQVPGPQDGVIPLGDGRRILVTRYGGAWSVWDRQTAEPVMDAGPWQLLLWQSDDGRWLLGLEGGSSGPFALRLVDVDSRTVRTLGDGVRARSMQVLDGRRVLFVRGLSSPNPDATGGTLVLAPIDGGEETVLATGVAPQIAVGGGRVFYAIDGTGAGDGVYSLALPP